LGSRTQIVYAGNGYNLLFELVRVLSFISYIKINSCCHHIELGSHHWCDFLKLSPLSQISALWDFFCFNVGGTTAEQSRGALSVLCMVEKTSTGVLGSHLQDIIDIGFGRWSKVDPLLARTACLAIERLSEDDKAKLLANNSVRIFGILDSLITGFWLPANIWYAAADKAITAIYAVHPTPEIIAADMIKKSLSSVYKDCGDSDSDTDTSSSMPITVQVAKLSRCLFVISHTAMNQLVYIESCARKIQKQKLAKERKDIESQNTDSNGTASTGTQKVQSVFYTAVRSYLIALTNCYKQHILIFYCQILINLAY